MGNTKTRKGRKQSGGLIDGYSGMSSAVNKASAAYNSASSLTNRRNTASKKRNESNTYGSRVTNATTNAAMGVGVAGYIASSGDMFDMGEYSMC
jgi:hypothetical protein